MNMQCTTCLELHNKTKFPRNDRVGNKMRMGENENESANENENVNVNENDKMTK